MAYSSIEETLTAPKQGPYLLAFEGVSPGYISQEHVVLYINEVKGSTIGASLKFTTPTTVNILGYTTQIGDVIKIRRQTPFLVPYTDYESGGQFDEPTLDNSFRQLVYVLHEVMDGYNITPPQTALDMAGQRVINVGDPVDPTDALNLRTYETAVAGDLATVASGASTVITVKAEVTQLKSDTQDIKDAAVSETTAIKDLALAAQAGAELAESNAQAHEVEALAQADRAAAIAGSLPNALARHAVQSYGNGINIDATQVKGNEVLDELGDGLPRSINFGLDAISGNNNFLALFKNKGNTTSWRLCSTLLGVGKELYPDLTNGLSNGPNGVTAFTTTGVDVGDATYLNELNKQIAEFGFQTTHKWKRQFNGVKSVVFDIADSNGGSIAGRSIEFVDTAGSIIPLSPADFSVYASGEVVNYEAVNLFDTSLSKTGAAINVSWDSGSISNQRIVIVFNTNKDIQRLIVNNYHNSGTGITAGLNNTKIYTSSDAITDTTYGATISNSELIFDGVIAQHPATDTVDDRGYCGVEWAYNPATGVFMFIHDGDGVGTFPIYNPTGKTIVFLSGKSLEEVYNHIVYTDKTGVGKYLFLNTTASVATEPSILTEMTETAIKIGQTDYLNKAGRPYFTWGFVGEDLGHLTPGMTGVEGSFACVELTNGGTFDCGMAQGEVGACVLKQIDGSTNWIIKDSASGFDKELYLNLTNTLSTANTLTFAGTNLTVPSGLTGRWLVMVIGKNGMMPSGKTLNITADTDNPFVASIADGYSQDTGQKDYMISEATNKMLTFTESDGNYTLCVDYLGNYTLESTRPTFDSTPGVMRSPSKKLPIADVTVLDGSIVDIDLMPVGDSYETPWFPVTVNTKYVLDNLFKSTQVDFDIWWNSEPLDENKRWVTGQYFSDGAGYGMGAYRRVSGDSLYVGVGDLNTFYSSKSGDPASSQAGYYKLSVRRGF